MMITSTIRSFFYSICMALTMAILVAACKGEVGPKGDTGAIGATGATGPAGVSGVAGATGPAGVSGISGTSSVTQVTFNTAFAPTAAGRFLSLPTSISKATIDKSLVVVYVQISNAGTQVYPLPGNVFGDEITYLLYEANSVTQNLSIYRTSGTNIANITLVRVLIIPAATVINGRKAAVDYSNYEAVKAYYDLKD